MKQSIIRGSVLCGVVFCGTALGGCGGNPDPAQQRLVDSWVHEAGEVDRRLAEGERTEESELVARLGKPDMDVSVPDLESQISESARVSLFGVHVKRLTERNPRLRLAFEAAPPYYRQCRMLIYDEAARYDRPCGPAGPSGALRAAWHVLFGRPGRGFQAACFLSHPTDGIVSTHNFSYGNEPGVMDYLRRSD